MKEFVNGYGAAFFAVADETAALRAENARLREVLQLGTYLLTIPAIRDIMKSQLENEELSPIADFENSARAALESTNA